MNERDIRVVTRTIELDHFKDKIKIWFFGDVHRFTASCDEDRWRGFLRTAKEEHTKDSYYIGLGDYTDFASTREQKALKSEMHVQTITDFDEIVKKRNRVLSMEMGFMKPNILGLIDGNHGWTFQDGRRGTEDLSDRLGTEYLSWICYLTLRVIFKNYPARKTYIDIMACHGRAGGKTVGASVNQVEELKLICPMADIYCVSRDTELLTTEGWKSYDQIKTGDPVFSYNIETNEVEEDVIKEIVSYPYNGEMISIKNKNTDQLLIPEHRVYYKHRKSNYIVNTASHLKNIHAQISLPLAGSVNQDNLFLSDDFCSLCGWIVSEGHFKGGLNDHGQGILIYQKRQDKVKIIEDLLKRLDINFTKRVNTEGVTVFYIKTEDAVEIRKLIDSKKRLPDWIYSLNNLQFDLFWDAFVMGDGNRISATAGTAYSADKLLMDDLQQALVLHGYRSNYKFKEGGFKDGGYVMTWCKKTTTDINTKKIIKAVDYNGIVWCITTNNHTFIARRNRKPFITGNCMGHDHQRWARPTSVLVPTWVQDNIRHLKQKRQFLCRSGSFKKAYTPNVPSYEVGRLLRPADLGALQYEIGFHRDQRDGKTDIVVTDIKATI